MGLKAVLYPASQRADTNVLVRLGRVVHWLSLIVAGCAMAMSVMILASSISSSKESHRLAAEWDKTHPWPKGGPPPIGTATPNPFDQFDNADNASEPLDDRPYERDPEYAISLAFALAAICIAMGGRGIRYILANE